jgi:hypothetical protein
MPRTPELPPLEQLPCRRAADVRAVWPDFVRELANLHAVAIHDDSCGTVVALDAATYGRIVDRVAGKLGRDAALLERLTAEFNARFSALQGPNLPTKIEAVFASRGKLRSRPKAGSDF